MLHSNLIQLFPNVVGPNLCNALIDVFELHPNDQRTLKNEGRPNFRDISLQRIPAAEPYLSVLQQALQRAFQRYVLALPPELTAHFPERFNLEEFRVKRYLPGGEERFDTHVDVQDHLSARRFLAFLLYLNTVEQGGETVFQLDRELVFQPQQGSILVFPPSWSFPHRGAPPISGPKYIFSSYLQFL